MVILPFDPNLETDAFRLHRIGFTLIQIKQGNMRLIQYTSSSLTPTHQRYTVCKLECMAVEWAIKKSDFYLRGLPHFEIWTDHKPLVGLFSNGLNNLDNPRLMRFREKIMFYNFSIKWVLGKTHYIADTLSRTPVFSSAELDEDPRDVEDTIDTLPQNLQRPSSQHHNRSGQRQSLCKSSRRTPTNRKECVEHHAFSTHSPSLSRRKEHYS